MFHLLSRLLGRVPNVYDLPYHQRSNIITLSTAVERVK